MSGTFALYPISAPHPMMTIAAAAIAAGSYSEASKRCTVDGEICGAD
jgi:hypothetical protein